MKFLCNNFPRVGKVAIKKEITHKRLVIRTTIQVVALEVYLIGKGKRTVCSICLPTTNQVTDEDMIISWSSSQHL